VEGAVPGYFSFRSENLKFKEVVRLRNVNPPRAALFELDRLSNFDIRVPEGVLPNMQVGPTSSLVYYGAEIGNDAVTSDTRLFVRAMCTFESANADESVPAHAVTTDTLKAMLEDVLGTLEGVVLSATVPATQCNHLFLTTTSVISLAPEAAAALCEQVFMSCTDRLLASKVMQVEWVVQLEGVKLRCFAQLDGRLNSSSYVEDDSGHLSLIGDQDDDLSLARSTSTTTPRKFVGQLAMAPHQVLDETVRRRCRARAMQTTFVFDYIHLFNASAALEWDSVDASLWPTERPTTFVEVQDMVVDQSDPEAEVVGLSQANYNIKDLKCGMIAWLITMKTIEYPDGRPIVVIANDITFMSGSFGVEEDYVYAAASRYARKHGLPRVYIAANAGARIGLAEEVKRSMRVAWNSPDDPAKGFKYLYLTEADYNELNADTKSVVASRVTDAASGEVRYQIDDVIGQKNGLGVENLQCSGLIAGETSRSYNECFSITYTTARTVGIGAYVLRLGQRAIQHNECSIILTGSRALNKLLGSEVYTSNQQLGGTRVMHNNGVSHLCAVNDADGINKIVKWIRYVPIHKGAPLPVTPTPIEEIERDVEYMPTRAPYDPRCLVAGGPGPDGRWLKGFFDDGSWMETLEGWAKSVVVGRGKLGGLPMGAVLVETRTIDKVVPADPASPESKEEVQPQAGQVWFPDSAYKTAQAIGDFSREGLPIIVFANWRGFSGGMRDMYQEVLKYGSMIVDALIECKQPVFVYIPPKGELRGGAWVVLDPMINNEVMEMYADQDSRGGVLEPAGIV